MKHPKRAITRDIRTRRPKRPDRATAESEALTWPDTAVRVKDVMARPALTFRQEMMVGAAVRAMRARKIRHAPIVDDKGAVIGIVTDRDLRQALLEPALEEEMEALGKALRARALKDVMTWGVITVKPETDIREAARLMHANKIGALPVVRDGKPVGMLTGSDVLKTLVQILDEGVVSKPGRWGSED
jgi:acetoin utilization protein AcuB